jgi:hypothetical protein
MLRISDNVKRFWAALLVVGIVLNIIMALNWLAHGMGAMALLAAGSAICLWLGIPTLSEDEEEPPENWYN